MLQQLLPVSLYDAPIATNKITLLYDNTKTTHLKTSFCYILRGTILCIQDERNFLSEKVFPLVNELCEARGTSFHPVDLRGSDPEFHSVTTDLLLATILDNIQTSPYHICLLGERYGPHRPMGAMKLPTTLAELSPEASPLDRTLVIVWLSMGTGEAIHPCQFTRAASHSSSFPTREQVHVLLNQAARPPDGMYRELSQEERVEKLKMYKSESADSAERLAQLKAKIAKRGLPIQYFKNMEELASKVIMDWSTVINKLYPPFPEPVSEISEY